MALLDRAGSEHAEPLLLVGDAGMGKTALLDAAAQEAAFRRIRVVRTRSPDGADASPFSLVQDIVRGLSDDLALLSRDDGEILRTAPRNSASRPGSVAGALLQLLAESAHRQTVLLLLDDLHWADRDSLAALCLAVGRLQAERVAVVGAARPRPALDPRLRAWAGIEVTPLTLDAAVRLLRAHLPAPGPRGALDERRARTLAEALGRCPLALVEASHLLTPAQLAGTAPLPDPLPVDDHLMAAWGRVWMGLPPPTRTALLALCVTAGSGTGVLGTVLADLGLGPEALDPTSSDRLLVPADGPLGVELAHPLIGDAVLAAAGPARVRAMQRRSAAAAESLGLSPSIIVAHLAASAVPGDEAIIAHLLDQADRALTRDLTEPAGRALLAAATLTVDPSSRAHLAARAIEVLLSRTLTSDFEPALAVVDESGTEPLPPAEQLWVEWARSEQLSSVDQRQHLRSIRATASHARQVGSPILSWTLFSVVMSAWSLGDGETATTYAAALRDLAGTSHAGPGSPLPPWACRAVHAVNLFEIGRVAESHDELRSIREESRAWLPSASAPSDQMIAIMVLDSITGQLDAWIDDRLASMHRWFLRNDGETVSDLRCVQAERARRRAEFATARALLDEGLALFTPLAASLAGIGMQMTTSVLTLAAMGDGDSLHDEGARLREAARRIGWTQLLDVPDRAEGLLALGEGRIDDALLHLEPLAEPRLLGHGPWDVVPTGRADLVEALTRAGQVGRARAVAQALGTTLEPSPDPFARGLVRRVRGLTATGDEAGAWLQASADAFREAGDPFEEARSRLLLGELLRRERSIEPARHELRLASAALERMGAAPWQARALGELRATRAAVPEPTPHPLSRLTPQERRVAEAVAAGGTDRQVAAELFLSARTVGYHLASVYRKLGVTNRTALAAYLAQERSAAAQAGPG